MSALQRVVLLRFLKGELRVHAGVGRPQDNFSHKTKLESYAIKMKGVPSQEQVSRGQQECCDHQMSGNSGHAARTGYVVNNTPAHMPQAHSMSFHQQQHLRYQAIPNSHSVQHIQEVPMYKRVEPARNFHGDSSFVQSAPHHSQQFHHSRLSNNQNQQRPPLEHLDMSASSSFSTCNSRSSSSFISHHSMNCSTAEDESDQPINYSLKDQDISSSYRDSTSSSRGNVFMNYDYSASGDGGLNFRPHMVPENLRRTALKGYNGSWNNNSTACDKLAAHVKGGDIHVSSSKVSTSTPRKPVPNLVHSHFHTPHGYQSVGVPHHQHSYSQFMTPQAPYTNASFHPRSSLHASSRSSQNPRANLQPNVAVSHSGYSSEGKMLNTGACQNHNLQTAHQNASRPNLVQQFNSTYPETDLDIVVDQLTNFSLRHKEVLEEKFRDGRQDKLINYSVYSHDSGEREDYDVCTYRDKRHYVDCKYTDIMLPNDSSNCDQVRTFCTEGSLNLSTVTSFTGLTPSGKIESKEKTVGAPKQIEGTFEKNSTASSTHIVAANMSEYQTPAKQTVSTVIAACKGLGLGTATPKSTSQTAADDRMAQENFYSCVDFNEAALDQTKTYCEEGTPINFSPVSSHSSLYSTNPGETNLSLTQNSVTGKIKLSSIGETDTPKSVNKSVEGNKRAACPMTKPVSNFRHSNTEQVLKEDLEFTRVACHDNNQVEETPLMFSRSSSPQSLNSCDSQSIHSSVASEYSWKTNEIVSPSEVPDSPSELMPPSQVQIHSLTRQFKDVLLLVKSLNFNRTQSTVMADTCDDPALCEKSINFARRNAEIQVCSELEDNQHIDVSLVHREKEDSHLMSSMLQKVIQSADRNQNAHLMNKVLTSQARVMSVVEEQDVDTESSSGNSEDLVEYAEEGTPQDFSETTSLSAITIDSSVKDDVSEFSNLQLQPQESEEEREPVSPIMDGQEAPAILSVAMEGELVKDEVKREDGNTTVSDDCRNISVSDENSDSSVSDVSQEEESILAQCISSGMPTSVSSAYKIKRKRQPEILVKTSPDAYMKHPAKMSSILKSAPKKLAPFFNSLPDIVKSDDIFVAIEDCLQLDIPKNETGSELATHKTDFDGRKRSPSSNFSSSSCSSTNLPITQFRKNLKQIGGNIESPESRVRLGAVFELSDECSLLEQAYFQSVPIQLHSAL